MMVWPSWLWIGSRLKFSLWLANRFATWTGMAYCWKRFRAQRFFWVSMILMNTVSFGGLCLLFFWLHVRSSH